MRGQAEGEATADCIAAAPVSEQDAPFKANTPLRLTASCCIRGPFSSSEIRLRAHGQDGNSEWRRGGVNGESNRRIE